MVAENMDIHMTMDNALFTSLLIIYVSSRTFMFEAWCAWEFCQQRVFVTDRFHKILIKRKEEAGEEVSQGRCASTVGLTSPPSK